MKRQAYNPYLPAWNIFRSGEPEYLGTGCIIFGSHDRFGAEGYCEKRLCGMVCTSGGSVRLEI
mgnify:CR=1 FL=1